ncbi:hypothetical protein HPB50_008394 [Hyalomma asiaticum]|uniref:Uncharacterized protein n=1 Tax=Hyalomma asiaticum TaxID=266040 RepID=A0ACB7SUB2_HYAAI|nr:hypothetical protein HPB50_008394 [Hyalomma asiaticum]
MPQREMTAVVNRPVATVNVIIRAFREEGVVDDAVRAVQERATAPKDLLIVAAVVVDPFRTTGQIRDKLGLHVSADSVARILHEAGTKAGSSRESQRLRRRIVNSDSCSLELTMPGLRNTGSTWFLTDEASFCTQWDQRQRVCRREQFG